MIRFGAETLSTSQPLGGGIDAKRVIYSRSRTNEPIRTAEIYSLSAFWPESRNGPGTRGFVGFLAPARIGGQRNHACALRSDVHEETSVKTGARRLRDFPDIHSPSSALATRHESVCGRSHSTPRRRIAPRRTSGCDLIPEAVGQRLEDSRNLVVRRPCALGAVGRHAWPSPTLRI
jgi:hypothetical protein